MKNERKRKKFNRRFQFNRRLHNTYIESVTYILVQSVVCGAFSAGWAWTMAEKKKEKETLLVLAWYCWCMKKLLNCIEENFKWHKTIQQWKAFEKWNDWKTSTRTDVTRKLNVSFHFEKCRKFLSEHCLMFDFRSRITIANRTLSVQMFWKSIE